MILPTAKWSDHADANGNSPLAIASQTCRRCAGTGMAGNWRRRLVCGCVHRRVFRACLISYQHCEASMGAVGAVQYERVGNAQGRCAIIASFKRAEYAADFVLVARRALCRRPVERAVFEAFHLDDLAWLDAVPRVNRVLSLARPLDRGRFFHAVYRAEGLIGRAILTVRPYSLFPPRDYFAGFGIAAIPKTARR